MHEPCPRPTGTSTSTERRHALPEQRRPQQHNQHVCVLKTPSLTFCAAFLSSACRFLCACTRFLKAIHEFCRSCPGVSSPRSRGLIARLFPVSLKQRQEYYCEHREPEFDWFRCRYMCGGGPYRVIVMRRHNDTPKMLTYWTHQGRLEHMHSINAIAVKKQKNRGRSCRIVSSSTARTGESVPSVPLEMQAFPRQNPCNRVDRRDVPRRWAVPCVGGTVLCVASVDRNNTHRSRATNVKFASSQQLSSPLKGSSPT